MTLPPRTCEMGLFVRKMNMHRLLCGGLNRLIVFQTLYGCAEITENNA